MAAAKRRRTSGSGKASKPNPDAYNPCEMERELASLGGEELYTTENMLAVIKKNNVSLISLMHIGEDGLMKMLDFCPKNEQHLIKVLEGGERCDGSSIFPHSGIAVTASDIVLRPRLESAFFDPFAPTPRSVLCFLCSHYGADGELLPQSPDTIVQRAEEELAKHGLQLYAHGEVEFFIGKEILTFAEDVGKEDRGYHASAPFVFGQELRRDALRILASLGIHVKYGHSECGYIAADEQDSTTWEQHEVELALEPLAQAARSAVLTKWVLASLAAKCHMRCSFDPICRVGHIGSGFHVHMSPRAAGAAEDEYMLVRDPSSGDLLPGASHIIAGLTQVGGALMAFGNRTASSFVRLNQGKEAPNTVCWGDRNRHALIRLPLVAKDSAGRLVAPPTVEFRLGDGSAHPHLLMAGLAMAMIHGKTMDPAKAAHAIRHTEAKPGGGGETAEARKVPKTAEEVYQELRTFRGAFEYGGVFPAVMIEAMAAGRFA